MTCISFPSDKCDCTLLCWLSYH